MGIGGMLTSCSDEMDIPAAVTPGITGEPGYITLELKTGTNITRADEDATEPGIDEFNENKINSVTLCLSPAAGDRADDDAPVYMETFTDLNANGSAKLRIPLTMELITRLFGEGNTNENNSPECRVFAAVNIDPGNATTVTELREMVVTSTFKTKQKQDGFTMDSDGTITYDRRQNYAIGKIIVKRSAAKITLALNVDSEIKEVVGEETLTWKPDYEGMRVRLVQGVAMSNLDPKAAPNKPYTIPAWQTGQTDIPTNVTSAYFNTADDLTYLYDFKDDQNEPKYNWIQSVPFYTYPNKWTNAIDEPHGTFMMLSVPWSSDGGQSWRTCYYHVPIIPFNQFELVRNNSYHVRLHVGVLGSFVPEEPLEVEADYFVADWGETSLDVDIKDYRYLVVDQNNYVVNNENSISIPFYTSHKTEVVAAEMKFWRFNFSDEGTAFAVTVTENMNKETNAREGKPVFTAIYDNDNNQLNVIHDLKIWQPYDAAGQIVDLTNGVETLGADRKKTQTEAEVKRVLDRISFYKEVNDDEYSMVEYTITVQHSDVADGSSGIDKKLYKETITIQQFPGMYITALQNNTISNAEHTTLNGNGAYGNTIINGRYDNYVSWNNNNNTGVFSQGPAYDNRKIALNAVNWDYSLGLSTGNLNWNPNMYLVTITNLPENTEFKIDDPRSYYVNNFLSNEDVDGQHLDPWPAEYWKRVYAGSYWNVERLQNPTQAEINTIMNGITYSGNIVNWNQGYKVGGFTTAPALEEASERTLRYYYPTREAEENSNTVAPKFRICSSYGGTWAYLTREMARRRAAAYQEFGYCAGRWRLPTFGEVRFVMELSRQNKIPRLFGRETGVWYYWCAQGAVLVPARGDTTTEIKIVDYPGQNGNPEGGNSAVSPFTGNNFRDHARFVYDEWYWGEGRITPTASTPNETAPIYPFTWGDKQKSNPEN